MSGIEGKGTAGGAQSAGTGQEAAAPAQRRDVPADEANLFSKSLAKDGGQGGEVQTAQQKGKQQGLPQGQTAGSGSKDNASAQGGEAEAAQQKSKQQGLPQGQSARSVSTNNGGAQGGETDAAQQKSKQPGLPQGQSTANAGNLKASTGDQVQVASGLPRPHTAQQNAQPGESALPDQMAALATASQQQAAGASATTAAAPAPQDNLSDLAEKLTSRILASKPESGASEVRIELSMNKLQGAVITMRQDANGLNIVFDAPSPEVAGRLAETRGDLVQRLQNATGENVNVEIKEQEGDQDQQPEDGRSRNQYEAAEHEDEGDV